jgi:hypothetical protein
VNAGLYRMVVSRLLPFRAARAKKLTDDQVLDTT